MQRISIVEMLANLDPDTVAEQSVTVPQEHNTLVAKLSLHSWIAVFDGGEELVREESTDAQIGFFLAPGTYTIKTDGKIKKVSTKAMKKSPPLIETFKKENVALLQMASDAPDCHVVDGIGEIAADGQSFCTINIAKIDPDGQALNTKNHKDEIFLRTTGGFIMDVEGNERIRSLKLGSGQAAFRLVSENAPKVVTVSAFGKEVTLDKSEIQIEFV